MSLDLDPNHIFRDFVTDGIPASGRWDPRKVEVRAHLTAMWQAVIALLADADPNLPLPNLLIRAADAGEGSPNAIDATTNLPLPASDASALIALNIFEANTGSPVTVSFNGSSPLTIKTNNGNDLLPSGLQPGMIVLGFVSDGTFRILSDQVSASIIAAAEAAASEATSGADRAQSFAAMLSADKIKLPAVLELLADEMMSYDAEPGHIQVGAGDIIEAGGFRYAVAERDATDGWLVETEGGVKLSSVDSMPLPEAFGAIGDGVANDHLALSKWRDYHVAKGLRGYRLRGGATYLIDNLVFPTHASVIGNFARAKRRVNNGQRLVEFEEYAVGYDLIADGSLDTLGREGATNAQTGFVLNSFAKLYNCEAYQNYRHGFSATGAIGVEAPELHSCYAHDNGSPHPTLPPSAGAGSGDGINFTNVNNGIIRDPRSFNNARSDIVVTTFDPVEGYADPSLSVGCLISNPKAGGAGYAGADINLEKVTAITLENADVPDCGITFRDSPQCRFIKIKCNGLNGTEGTHNTVVRDVEIENNNRTNDLLVITGDDPDVRGVKTKSSATTSGNAVLIRPANRRGHVHDVDVDGANNGIVIDVDNASGLTGRNVVGVQVRYGPVGSNLALGFSSNLLVNAGIADFRVGTPPASGVWAQGSIARRTVAASGQPAFWQYTGSAWVAGPNFP